MEIQECTLPCTKQTQHGVLLHASEQMYTSRRYGLHENY